MNTEGLLLLTTDGELKRALELPANAVERRYRVRVYGRVEQSALESLSEGVTIEGVRYGSILADLERRTGANAWLTMTLTEGKNREVRRVLEHLGLEVSRLIRTAYGPFALGDLGKGQAVEVRKEELERFRSSLKGGVPRQDGGRRPPKPPARRTEAAPEGKPARPPRRPSRARPGRPDAAGGARSDGRPTPAPRKGPKGPRK